MTGETEIKTAERPQVPAVWEDTLNAMAKARVFDVANGKVTINFHDGHVQSIVVEERRYQHVALTKALHIPI